MENILYVFIQSQNYNVICITFRRTNILFSITFTMCELSSGSRSLNARFTLFFMSYAMLHSHGLHTLLVVILLMEFTI